MKEILQSLNFTWPLLLCCLLWLTWSVDLAAGQHPAHIDTALTYFGTQDLPNQDNYGPDIERFLSAVGLPQGNPYCAAFVSYCLSAAGAAAPTTRSALASHFIMDSSIDAKKVMRGQIEIPAGTIGIYRRGNTIFGHAVMVLFPWRGPTGITIEGNTSPMDGYGFEGDGVWIRRRTIYPANYFRITHFTLVTY